MRRKDCEHGDGTATEGIALSPLTARDVAQIHAWPKYSERFALLDYALRPGGWLDMFPEGDTTRRIAARLNNELVAFSLLVDITNEAAEFYIAVHPAKTGKRYGEQVTAAVLRLAFGEMQLKRIYLKVRDWHTGAMRLYERCGFVATSSTRELIQGQMVDFCFMEARAPIVLRS